MTLRKAFMVFTISYVTSPFLEIHIVCLILGLSIAMDLIFQPYLGVEGVSPGVSKKLQLWDTSSMFCIDDNSMVKLSFSGITELSAYRIYMVCYLHMYFCHKCSVHLPYTLSISRYDSCRKVAKGIV